MGKIEEKRESEQYARVMHHIGGIGGKNDNSNMIRGGEDSLTLLNTAQLNELHEKGVDVKRLIDLGTLRKATEQEVEQFEIASGIREAATDSQFFANFTSGDEGLNRNIDPSKTGVVGASADNDKGTGTAAGLQGDKAADSKQGGDGDIASMLNGGGNTDTTNGGTGGSPSGGSGSYKGMTKGELSEHYVPELKEMAKGEQDENGNPLIPEYATMLKDDLLDALLALGK